MKWFLKTIISTAVTLYLISKAFPQVQFASVGVLITTGIVLTILMVIVKPFLKILLLPINIITFGMFAWMINILVLYLATILVPGFVIGSITVPSVIIGPFLFPTYTLTTFWSMFLVSFLVSIGNGIIGWVL